MWKRILLWLLLVAVAAATVYGADCLFTQRSLTEKTVRLHVVANSDSEADQAQKLRVRDAVVQTASALTARCKTAAEAERCLRDGLGSIETAAEQVLRREGCAYPVSVSLQEEEFETRRYDTFTLPAGRYPALRVVLGEGAGHNWWCVVFPSLCMAASADEVAQAAAAGGFDDSEGALVTGGEETYILRFKTMEWLQALARFFRAE